MVLLARVSSIPHHPCPCSRRHKCGCLCDSAWTRAWAWGPGPWRWVGLGPLRWVLPRLAWVFFSEGLLGACLCLQAPATFPTVAIFSHTLYSAFVVMLLGARCLGGLGSCVGEGVAR